MNQPADVLKVGEPGTNFVVAGTSIHREAVTCVLSDNPGWRSRRYKSVLKWPDALDTLWAEWERVLMNLADPGRLDAARARTVKRACSRTIRSR